jgi:hypothetical protein
MPVVSCICQDCGKSFYKKETYAPMSGRNIFVNNKIIKKDLKTWNDWIMHTVYFCENCRIQTPPAQCLEDYEKLNKMK